MQGLLLAPSAKFLKLNLPFHLLLVLARPIIHVLAGATGELDEIIL